MIKIDVNKELKNEKKSSIGESTANSNVEEIKLLLSDTASQERELLKEAGLYSNIAKIEDQVSMNIERKNFETRMNGDVFTEEEIKRICVKYNLRFLKSSMYKGNIDPLLGAKLVKFYKENNMLDTSKYESANNLFIMAPQKAFNLKNLPIPPKEQPDPAIFYRMRDRGGKEYFTMIHKWGNDFTIARRLKGLIMRNKYTYLSTWFASAMAIAFIVFKFPVNMGLTMNLIFSPLTALVSIFLYKGHQILMEIEDLIDERTEGTFQRGYRAKAQKQKFELRFSEFGWNSVLE
jgi:hypothetical protein